MASQIVNELRTTTDAAWSKLSAQLQGMERHLERSDAPGEWTTRQVLCHLLGAPGWRPVPVLSTFVQVEPGEAPALPLIDVVPGQCHVTPERQMMKLQQFRNAIDRHRREVFDYLESLSDADLQRKARIPLFKQFLGTDLVTMPVWVTVFFVVHWGDHAGQLAKIRQAVGLPEAKLLAVVK